jgi:hypothetical protein
VRAIVVPGRSIRRIDVAASWRRARADYAALVAERDALKAELAEVTRIQNLLA